MGRANSRIAQIRSSFHPNYAHAIAKWPATWRLIPMIGKSTVAGDGSWCPPANAQRPFADTRTIACFPAQRPVMGPHDFSRFRTPHL